jgi:hypothetical protein
MLKLPKKARRSIWKQAMVAKEAIRKSAREVKNGTRVGSRRLRFLLPHRTRSAKSMEDTPGANVTTTPKHKATKDMAIMHVLETGGTM